MPQLAENEYMSNSTVRFHQKSNKLERDFSIIEMQNCVTQMWLIISSLWTVTSLCDKSPFKTVLNIERSLL